MKRMGTDTGSRRRCRVPCERRVQLHHGANYQRQRRPLLLRIELFHGQKTLLIVSGGIEAADAAKRAKEMGLNVVVSDRDPEAPGFAFADSCIIADVYGAERNAPPPPNASSRKVPARIPTA